MSMSELYDKFLYYVNEYAINFAAMNHIEAEDARDNLIKMFFKAYLTDSKSEVNNNGR